MTSSVVLRHPLHHFIFWLHMLLSNRSQGQVRKTLQQIHQRRLEMHPKSLLFVLSKSNCIYHLFFSFCSGRPARVRASCSQTHWYDGVKDNSLELLFSMKHGSRARSIQLWSMKPFSSPDYSSYFIADYLFIAINTVFSSSLLACEHCVAQYSYMFASENVFHLATQCH